MVSEADIDTIYTVGKQVLAQPSENSEYTEKSRY